MATVPTPYHFTAGSIPTASAMNGGLESALSFLLNPPCCSIYQSASGSVATATWTRVLWDSEHYDTDTMHSTSSNTGRITFNTSGLYRLTIDAFWDSSSTGGRGVNLTKNNAGSHDAANVVLSDGFDAGVGSTNQLQSVAIDRRFTAGDYIEMWVYQSSGGALNFQGGYNKSALQARWVGA